MIRSHHSDTSAAPYHPSVSSKGRVSHTLWKRQRNIIWLQCTAASCTACVRRSRVLESKPMILHIHCQLCGLIAPRVPMSTSKWMHCPCATSTLEIPQFKSKFVVFALFFIVAFRHVLFPLACELNPDHCLGGQRPYHSIRSRALPSDHRNLWWEG